MQFERAVPWSRPLFFVGWFRGSEEHPELTLWATVIRPDGLKRCAYWSSEAPFRGDLQ